MTRVGITGHRSLPDPRLATGQVEDVLEKIRMRFDGPYELYSSLAEGADRLGARGALELMDAGLVVPLPLRQEDFLAGCSAASRAEFNELLSHARQVIELPPASTPAQAYESAGRFILEHVDVLIALWDGRPPRGPGGTGQMVSEARACSLPLAWIHAGEAAITYENFRPSGRKAP